MEYRARRDFHSRPRSQRPALDLSCAGKRRLPSPLRAFHSPQPQRREAHKQRRLERNVVCGRGGMEEETKDIGTPVENQINRTTSVDLGTGGPVGSDHETDSGTMRTRSARPDSRGWATNLRRI